MSGVSTAEELIQEWRRLLFNRSRSEIGYQAWLNTQDWYEHEDEYSLLFEAIYDQPSQRRVFIEECVKEAHPSWGYVYLTSLMDERYFDGIFTTNFDDLVNEACYVYSDGLRPLVAAHDSAIQGIRVTSMRPKIIKLHGDFLYDNIKNTLAELETLEENTKRKLKQFAQEYGLVVIGYSGRDRSVMDTLELLLKDDEHYKQGVYWCVHRGATVSARLRSLLRHDRVCLIEVDGFDEFMADLHRSVRLKLPRPIANPLDMARDRMRLFLAVNRKVKAHTIIDSDIKRVLKAVETHPLEIPLPLQAAILSARGVSDEAMEVWRRAYDEDPSDKRVTVGYADALAEAALQDELRELVASSEMDIEQKTYYLLRADCNEEVVELADDALQVSSAISESFDLESAVVRVNRAIALKRLGRRDEMTSELLRLEESGVTVDPRLNAAVAALKGDKERMLTALKAAINVTLSPNEIAVFPVFEDYRDDPQFVDLIGSRDDSHSE